MRYLSLSVTELVSIICVMCFFSIIELKCHSKNKYHIDECHRLEIFGLWPA